MQLCIKYVFILAMNHDGLSRCDISHRDAPNVGWLQLQTSLATRRTQANIANILEHLMQSPSKHNHVNVHAVDITLRNAFGKDQKLSE